MTVNFYTNYSDNKKLKKNLSEIVFSADVEIFEDCSLNFPRLRLSYQSAIASCNYFYVSSWNRCYFIKDVTFTNAGQMIVKGEIDVLMSNQVEILNKQTLISRYEKAGLSTIPDTNVVIKDYNIINVYNSNKGFDTRFGNYVLEIYGG